MVLRDCQRAQAVVECMARERDLVLGHEKVEVHLPDDRHLVHEDKRARKHIIDLLAIRIDGREVAHAAHPLLQIPHPQLVADKKQKSTKRSGRGSAAWSQTHLPGKTLRARS